MSKLERVGTAIEVVVFCGVWLFFGASMFGIGFAMAGYGLFLSLLFGGLIMGGVMLVGGLVTYPYVRQRRDTTR